MSLELQRIDGAEVEFTRDDAKHLWNQIKEANKKLPERRGYQAEWGGLIREGSGGELKLNVHNYDYKSVKLFYSDISPNTIMTAHFHPTHKPEDIELSSEDLEILEDWGSQGLIACWNGFKMWTSDNIVEFAPDGKMELLEDKKASSREKINEV